MAPPPSHDLPEVPGLDQADLLERIGGDEALYWELLRELSGGYRDYPQRIARSLEDDLDEAKHLTHTLKGVLGNLGASELHIVCRDLHQAIRDGDASRWPALMKTFSAEFSALCDAIDAAAESSSAAAGTPQGWLRERYTALADALRANRAGECKSLVKEIAASALSEPERGQFTAIELLVRSYQFDDALRLVEDCLHE